MLIVCPTCANEYTLATDRIGATGRVVRCAACRGAWFVPPREEVPGALTVPGQNPFAPARQGKTSRPPAIRRPGRGWLALTCGLAAALALAFGLRKPVVHAVPQTAVVFAALGLPVNLVGLEIAGVTSEIATEAGERALLIRGEIKNPTGTALPVPPLALEIEGRAGDLLYAWSDRTQRGELGPKDSRSFQIRLPSPPPDGQRLMVAFAPQGPASTVASR